MLLEMLQASESDAPEQCYTWRERQSIGFLCRPYQICGLATDPECPKLRFELTLSFNKVPTACEDWLVLAIGTRRIFYLFIIYLL